MRLRRRRSDEWAPGDYCTYRVRVKVDDGGGGSASKEVTITVTDVLRASDRAVRAEGDGDERHGLEPRRDLERAAGHGEASHHRLRHTVSQVQGWDPERRGGNCGPTVPLLTMPTTRTGAPR